RIGWLNWVVKLIRDCFSIFIEEFQLQLLHVSTSSTYLFSNRLAFLNIRTVCPFDLVQVTLLQTNKSLCDCIQLILIRICLYVTEAFVFVNRFSILIHPVYKDKAQCGRYQMCDCHVVHLLSPIQSFTRGKKGHPSVKTFYFFLL